MNGAGTYTGRLVFNKDSFVVEDNDLRCEYFFNWFEILEHLVI